MQRLLLLLVLAIALGAMACSRSNEPGEAGFYGLWVKGKLAGDTLVFKNQDAANLLQYNASFNPALPVSNTIAYRYRSGKLQVALYGPEMVEISSFVWIVPGQQFQLQGFQLFPFMSSTGTKFTYTKVQ